jgi:hypothetical protein
MPIDLPPDPEPEPQPEPDPEESGSPAEILTEPAPELPARPATVPAARDCPGRRVMTNHDIPGLSRMFSTPVLQPVLAGCP